MTRRKPTGDTPRNGNIIALPRKPSITDSWRNRIENAWAKSVQAIVETGKILTEAKDALDHGLFLKMIETELPFSADTAQRLMRIACHSILSDAANSRHLPPNWTTLCELSRLPDELTLAKIKSGEIHPRLDGSHAKTLVKKSLHGPSLACLRQDIAAIGLADLKRPPEPPPAAVKMELRPPAKLVSAPIDRLALLIALWDEASTDERCRFLDRIGACR
jgi:hypothetical protein